jgi:hypothetical protein
MAMIVGRRALAASSVAVVLLSVAPATGMAADTVPVRVRVIKGSRQGPAQIDPKLADLNRQLAKLSYVSWQQVGEQQADMAFGKPLTLSLPDGSTLELTLADARKDTVTFDVKVPARKTHSRLTISKDQRIVHQVTDEKNGDAYFATVRPWP